MTDFTPARLAELRAVAEAATPGPWTTFDSKGEAYSTPPATGAMLVDYGADVDQQMRDVRQIAAFDPPTVLALIAALEAERSHMRSLAKWVGVDERAPSLEIACEVSAALEAKTAEVERITESRNEWASRMMELASETQRADRAEAALERVKALPLMQGHEEAHAECCGGKGYCAQCYGQWPCATIQAIEGTNA